MSTPIKQHQKAQSNRRIEDYALIGNTLTAALVGKDGSIDWLCCPRFDSPACFSRLLGTSDNGHWLISPRESIKKVERQYVDDTLILETVFTTQSGEVSLTDFMPFPREESAVEVVRIVKGVRGTVPMRYAITLRFDYGSVVPWVRRQDYGLSAIAGPDALTLRTPLQLRGKDFVTISEFTVHEGQTIPSVLSWYPSHKPVPPGRDPNEALEETHTRWQRWSSRARTEGQWSKAVRRSLITLKALTYSPTGGLVAAPTTSLPEQMGGHRNWDYRYCWLRDATFTLYALLISGYEDEARAWRDWLLRAVAGQPSKLQIMYGLAGERRLQEYEIPWLEGFCGSSPVRVGNGAHGQRQMDVYGEIMDAFHMALERGVGRNDEVWAVQRELMNHLCKGHWADLGSGLWESRGPERAYTFSRVMTWVAFDRAVKAVEKFGFEGPAGDWRKRREAVREDIFRHGFNRDRGSFVQTYGSRNLDAALLLLPLVGFIRPDDPRMLGTIEAIRHELVSDGFVRRYDTHTGEDGLTGGEGVFLICSFWLADNLALLGRSEEARELFERLLSIRNDVGLLSEEYDPRARRLLGNFPQAFSHIGLINTAHNLTLAQATADGRAAH
jgi:GH15 family glucan-1,4-alpha-glucosidase